MTHFHNRHPRRGDAWVTPGDDDLDDYLNAVATSGATDVEHEVGASSLAASAREFHRRLDEAQATDSRSTAPGPGVWNKILASTDHHRKDSTMSTAPLSLEQHKTVPGEVPSASSLPNRRHSRLGKWANALAAVSLVLLIGAGYWFSGYGPGGPGGGDDPRYAAQVVSPVASPGVSAVGCDVEPLTTDEIVAYVENPYSFMPRDVFGTPAPGDEILVVSEGQREVPNPVSVMQQGAKGIVASEDEFESAYAVAEQYYACMATGTNAQVWALTDPAVVQSRILIQTPVFRSEGGVRELVVSLQDEPATDRAWSVIADDSADGQGMYANGNIQDARVFAARSWMFDDADKVMYIGQEYRDVNEDIVSLTDWNAVALIGGEESSNGTSLILVHSKSTDRWFVVGNNAPRG